MFFQPDFELINIQSFSAQCAFLPIEIITEVEKVWRWLPYPHWEERTKSKNHGNSILHCELSDRSGSVTLKRRRVKLDGTHAHIGGLVLYTSHLGITRQEVTDINLAKGTVRTTWADGRKYVRFSQVEIYEPMENIELRDGVISIGDKILVTYGYGTTLETVTDIANDMILTTADNEYYFFPERIREYQPTKTITFANGNILSVGDQVLFMNSLGTHTERVTDIANGKVRVTWNDGEYYYDISNIQKID